MTYISIKLFQGAQHDLCYSLLWQSIYKACRL